MFKRLSSSKHRELVRMGFLIAKSNQDGNQPRVKFGEVFKHPLLLVFVGFVLSAVVGTWFTHSLDEQQKEREAITKQYDSLRSASDDLVISYERYNAAAGHMLIRMSMGENAQSIAQADNEYSAAFENWMQRLAADSIFIKQQTGAAGSSGSHVRTYLNLIETGSRQLDRCIQKQLGSTSIAKGFGTDIICHAEVHESDFSAEYRLFALSYCARDVAAAVHPHPLFDFKGPDAHNAMTNFLLMGLESMCSSTILTAVPMIDTKN